MRSGAHLQANPNNTTLKKFKNGMPPPILTRERRMKRFGIECVSEILFSGWKPDGRVHTQKLTLKNTGKSLQTLTYMLPQVPNFFAPFPDPIPLPVGMEYSIPISFKPTSTAELEAYLGIHSSLANEKFYIKLRAELPKLSCQIEQDLDFTKDPTAVAEKSSITTPLLNDGEIPFLFTFESLLPFTVSPITGIVLPNEQCPVTFYFNPKEAGSFSGEIVLTIKKTSPDHLARDDKLVYIVHLNGLAQYSFMRVSFPDQVGTVCCFRHTPLFSTVSKLVYLENDSNVPFSFSVHPSWEERAGSEDHGRELSEYSIEPRTGLIEAHGKTTLKVKYTPLYCYAFYNSPDVYNVEYVTIKALSGVKTQFSIEASACPVPLELSENKINLGVVSFGSAVSHSVQLKNTSKYPCPFEFSASFMRPYSTPTSFVDPISGKSKSAKTILSDSSELLSANLLIPDTADIGLTNQIRPTKRLLRDLPCYISPSSGIVPAGIAITLQIQLDLRGYTSEVSTLGSKDSDGKGFFAPYPLAGYIALKIPGGSPLFLLISASILPEKGIDVRPPPITLNYMESWLEMRCRYNIDELFSPLTPKLGEDQPRYELSPLFNDSELPEFAINEALKQLKGIFQPINQKISDYRQDSSLAGFKSVPDAANIFPYAMDTSKSLGYELFGSPLTSMKGGAGVKVSQQYIDFGYVEHGTAEIAPLSRAHESFFYIYNDSKDVSLIVSWTCSTIRGGFKLQFNGISSQPEYHPSMAYTIPELDEKDAITEFIASKGPISPTILTEDDGVYLPIVLTRGLVCRIPPQSYGHYSILFIPDQSDSFYHTHFTAICAHVPLLQYRSMRHCIVGSPVHTSISVTGCTRQPLKPTLSSGMPEISQPVVTMNSRYYLVAPPSAPGRVTRTSFALTNNTESHMIFSCISPTSDDDLQFGYGHDVTTSFLVVSPKIFVIPPNGGTKIVTFAVFFPQDAIENKTKYGYANIDRSAIGLSSTVLFATEVRFKMNGSEETNITINFSAVCSAPKLILTTASALNERLLLNFGMGRGEPTIRGVANALGDQFINHEMLQQLTLPQPLLDATTRNSGDTEEQQDVPNSATVDIAFSPVSIGSEVLHTCMLKNASAVPIEVHFDTSLYANEEKRCYMLISSPQVTLLQPHSILQLQFKVFADQTLLSVGRYQWPFNVHAFIPLNILPGFDIVTAINRADFYYDRLQSLCCSTNLERGEGIDSDAITAISTDLWRDVLNHYIQTPLIDIVRSIVSFGLRNHHYFRAGYLGDTYLSANIIQRHTDTSEIDKAIMADTLVTGRIGAIVSVTPRSVTLTPSVLNLGPFIPETSHDMQFVLKNNSNCSISFIIEIHEIMPNFPFLPDLDSSEASLKRYLFEQANDGTECYVPSLLNRLTKGESVLTDNQVKRCPTFFVRTGSCGIVHSNAQATITIVAVPRRAGFIKGRLVVKVVELVGAVLNENNILDELRSECIYVQGLAKQILSMSVKETDTLFVSNIELRANYPKFFIADASCPKVPSSQLRDILDVDSLNEFLLGDVTPGERVYRKSLLMREKLARTILNSDEQTKAESRISQATRMVKSRKKSDMNARSLSSSETTSVLNGDNVETAVDIENVKLIKSFPVVLGPGNKQATTSNYRVILSLANPYDIPVELSLTLPHEEPNLEACPWARSLPPKHEQRAMDLLSRGIFIIAPERIYLKKNEKRAFVITYSHVEEGVHELQVQVSIANGRVFILHLIGQTLGKDEPAVLAPIEQRFLPVALGEIISPRQIVKLTNPGKVGVNYAFLRPEMFIYSADGELILLDQDNDSPQPNLALHGLQCFSVEGHEGAEDASDNVKKELTVRQNVTDILMCLNPRGYLAPNSSINIVFSFNPKCVGFHHFKVGLVIYPTNKPGMKLERPRSHGIKENSMPGSANEGRMGDHSTISPINPRSTNTTFNHECESPRNDISMHTTDLEAYYDANILDIPVGGLVGYGEFDDDGLIEGTKPVPTNKLAEVRRSNTNSRAGSRCNTASSVGNSGVRSTRSSLPNSAVVKSASSATGRAVSAAQEQVDSRIYQVIDLVGYVFLPYTHVPQEIIPSYALGADADSPGCGSVTIKSQDIDPSLLANTQTGVGLCSLSYGRLILGALPCLGYTSTIVTITGSPIGSTSMHPYLSQFNTGHYEWSLIMPLPNPNIRISVHPQSGVLAPGETQPVLINVYTGSIPMVTIEDIGFSVTFITDKSALVRANTFNLESLSSNNRLSVTLANTQASAARIVEQAHHKGFNPQEITKAGIDIESRKHRAIFHGICLKGDEDGAVSTPLSRYSTHPHDDVLWVTLMCHTHRTADLECYTHAAWGLKLGKIACEMNDFGTVNFSSKEANEKYADLTQTETDELDKILKVTLRGIVNRLCTEETPKQRLSDAATRTKRRVLNGMRRANFIGDGLDNPVTILDSEDVEPGVNCAPFLQALSRAIFSCSTDNAPSGNYRSTTNVPNSTEEAEGSRHY